MTDREPTRVRLLDATRSLLWERGYAATSPRTILARAGVGQGSMYHHFSGKQDLARAAFERSADDVLARAAKQLRGAGAPVDRVIAYLLLQRDVLLGCPVGRMAGDADVLALDSLHRVLTDAFDRLRALVTDVLAEAVAAGDLTGDPAELGDTVLAVVQGGYVLARAAGDPAPFERATRGATALLTAAAKGTRS